VFEVEAMAHDLRAVLRPARGRAADPLAERLTRREHGLNTVVNTPAERVHPPAPPVNTFSASDRAGFGTVFTRSSPLGGERVNTPPGRERADEHGVNTCRHCGGPLDWPRPGGVAFADGRSAHLRCHVEGEFARLVAAAERAVLSPDALADEAELTIRGELVA
jgi:hypothetical protein